MIYHRKCNICGELLRINGSLNMDFKQHEHLRDVHPEEWRKRTELCNDITEAKHRVNNFDKTIWG